MNVYFIYFFFKVGAVSVFVAAESGKFRTAIHEEKLLEPWLSVSVGINNRNESLEKVNFDGTKPYSLLYANVYHTVYLLI